MRANLITLAGAAALCVATVAAADPCPSNLICVGANGLPCDSMTTVTAAREVIFNGGIWAYADYDWTAGTCLAAAQLPAITTPVLEAKVTANEDYVVTGIAPGTPLTIHARIRVVANANPSGSLNQASGWLEKAGAGRVEATAAVVNGPNVAVDRVLALDFAAFAGESFRLTMGAISDARGGTSSAVVTLNFVDLPAGAALSSCHSGSLPVPATPVTWGSLKSRYR